MDECLLMGLITVSPRPQNTQSSYCHAPTQSWLTGADWVAALLYWGVIVPYQSWGQYPELLLCCGLMLMGCSPGSACDVWCELPRRYHWARPFGLSKGRGGLGGFCVNNSWVYMVGSVQIDTICFPISRLAIEYKAHNQRQRARSTAGAWGNWAMIKS